MYIRLILIAIVLLLAVFILRRLIAASRRDPRVAQAFSHMGVNLLRVFLVRGLLGYLWRAVRLLRFLR